MPERYFLAVDANGDATIWRGERTDTTPVAMLRRSDLPYRARHLWPPLVQAVCGEPAFSCGRCGDDSEPADCPDRHGFDDHGLCCMGTCHACQHRIDQGETA